MSGLELMSADILYTGMGAPLRGGGVVRSGGTIAGAGPWAQVRAQFPQAVMGRRAAVMAPRPVNAHTHLDMSMYIFKALPYFRWIPEVVMANRAQRGLTGAKQGLAQVQASGAAGLGDIVWPQSEQVMEWLLSEATSQGVAYLEVLDPLPHTAEATFAGVVKEVRRLRRLERPGGMRLGLSPHATYTVSHKLHRLLADFARQEGLPLQLHVAEHASERELFASGQGALAESFLRSMHASAPGLTVAEVIGRAPSPELTPVGYLAELGVLDAQPTLIHMVNVSDADITLVAQAGASVVTCPRSNANLACGTFRWSAFAAAGVNVALGTDSVASGQSLNIHDEIAAAWRLHPHLDPRLVVRAAVKGGSRVLGLPVALLRRGEPWDDAYLWPDHH